MNSRRDLLEHLPHSIEGWIDVLRLDRAESHQQAGATGSRRRGNDVEFVEGIEADFDATGEVAEVLYVD
jgi:hypothetical protein